MKTKQSLECGEGSIKVKIYPLRVGLYPCTSPSQQVLLALLGFYSAMFSFFNCIIILSPQIGCDPLQSQATQCVAYGPAPRHPWELIEMQKLRPQPGLFVCLFVF